MSQFPTFIHINYYEIIGLVLIIQGTTKPPDENNKSIEDFLHKMLEKYRDNFNEDDL